jgi:D-glycero-D-manno-heptose 1,7-bisphosphate phosphatase
VLQEFQSLTALLDGIGCWAWTGSGRFDGRPALFLDRDGVIVEETGYLGRPQEVALIPGAAETIAAFNAAGTPVVVVTNQSGVARGYFSWADFEAVQAEIAGRLAAGGAHLDAVFACAFHEKGHGDLAVADHPWRKPSPGMLHAAAARLGIALDRSHIVGDKAGDLAAGKAAGLAGGLHVATGHGHGDADERTAAQALRSDGFEVMLGDDIGAARAWLARLAGA